MDGPRRGPSGGPGLAGERSRRPRLRGRSFALGRCTWSRALSAGQDKVWIWSSRPHPLTSAFVPERSAEGHEGRARGGVLPPLSFLPPRTPCPLTSASRSLSGARRVGVWAASRAAARRVSRLRPGAGSSSWGDGQEGWRRRLRGQEGPGGGRGRHGARQGCSDRRTAKRFFLPPRRPARDPPRRRRALPKKTKEAGALM